MDALLTSCGFNADNQDAVILTEGLDDVAVLATLNEKDISLQTFSELRRIIYWRAQTQEF